MTRKFSSSEIITINSQPVPSNEIDGDDIKYIYSNISRFTEFENNLLNQRLTWALIISGAFITAESFLGTSVIRDLAAQNNLAAQGMTCFFMAFLSTCAASICFTSYRAIEAACNQLLYLRRYYEECRINGQDIFKHALYLPRPFGLPDMHTKGAIQAKIIPPILMGMWILLTIIEFTAGTIFINDAINQTH